VFTCDLPDEVCGLSERIGAALRRQAAIASPASAAVADAIAGRLAITPEWASKPGVS
jgi:hypothetical protein